MVLYVPGAGTEPVRVEQYLVNGWYQSCGYSGCDCPQFTMSVPPGWHPDPTWNECATKYCCGGHGGCPSCIMTQSQIIADYQTEVTFITNPPGAQIFIDGTEWWPGAVTAADGATFRGIPQAVEPTPHIYELRKDGYLSVTRRFELVERTPITIEVELISLSLIGNVDISSTPPGAEIWWAPIGQTPIDTGLITPAIIPDLLGGWYDYKLTFADYLDSTGGIEILAGQTAILNVIMQPVPTTGNAYITSIPPGAEIYVDDIDQSITTPGATSQLVPGHHTYKLTLPGYRDTTGPFDVIAGETTNILDVALVPLTGILSIASTPAGAMIFIDDIEQIGRTTPSTIPGLSLGNHTYKLMFEGYRDDTGVFNIIADQTTMLDIDLIQITGTLDISSTPPGAKIYINDEEQIGVLTPATISLIPGYYTYKLTFEGYIDKTGIFDIIADQTTTIEDTLQSAGGGSVMLFGLVGLAALGIMMTAKPKVPETVVFRPHRGEVK